MMKQGYVGICFAMIAVACGEHQSAGRGPRPDDSVTQPMNFATLERGELSNLDFFKHGVTLTIHFAESFAAIYENMMAGVDSAAEPPDVDFEKYLVVIVTDPIRPTGGFAVEIKSVTFDDDSSHPIVDLERIRPDPGEIVTTAMTKPYHVVAVER